MSEVSGCEEHLWSTFKVWRHLCAYCIFALLSALVNTPSPLHSSVPKPSSWHPPPALGRLGGTWELNLYHPSDRVSNISGVQHFTGDRWGTGRKAPPGIPPPRRSARQHAGRKGFTRCKWSCEDEHAVYLRVKQEVGLAVCPKSFPSHSDMKKTLIMTCLSVGYS